MVSDAADWAWSAYRAQLRLEQAPIWLEMKWLWSQFSPDLEQAMIEFARFVEAGMDRRDIWQSLKGQIYLGGDTFIKKLHAETDGAYSLTEVPRAQRRPLAKPLSYYRERYPQRNDAIAAAFETGKFSQKEIADFFGVHYSTVSRIVCTVRAGKMIKFET